MLPREQRMQLLLRGCVLQASRELLVPWPLGYATGADTNWPASPVWGPMMSL